MFDRIVGGFLVAGLGALRDRFVHLGEDRDRARDAVCADPIEHESVERRLGRLGRLQRYAARGRQDDELGALVVSVGPTGTFFWTRMGARTM